MNDWAVLDLVVYFAGSLIALTQSIIFAHYYCVFRRDHLLLWSLSFLSLSIYLVASGSSWALLSSVPPVGGPAAPVPCQRLPDPRLHPRGRADHAHAGDRAPPALDPGADPPGPAPRQPARPARPPRLRLRPAVRHATAFPARRPALP